MIKSRFQYAIALFAVTLFLLALLFAISHFNTPTPPIETTEKNLPTVALPDADLHLSRRYPALGAGAARAKAILAIAALFKVNVIVDKIRSYLHEHRKQGAKQGGHGLEASGPHGQSTAHGHGRKRGAQGLGARSQHPRVQGIGTDFVLDRGFGLSGLPRLAGLAALFYLHIGSRGHTACIRFCRKTAKIG